MNYVRLSLCLLMLAGCEKGRGDIDGFGNIDFAGLDLTETDAETIIDNPTTCAEAEENKSYVGCDYWPTITANGVYDVFKFVVVVANPSEDADAEVTVTGANIDDEHRTIPPNSLVQIELPWIRKLKGPDAECTDTGQGLAIYPKPFPNTVKVQNGAYHLTSSIPVVAYQFNPLKYEGTGCPPCMGHACRSFTNDASLLLPSTAMTGNYRLAAFPSDDLLSSLVAITATQDNTEVTIGLTNGVKITAGDGISAVNPGQKGSFVLNRGDVVELVAEKTVKINGKDVATDFTGSLINATRPIQVIGGKPSSSAPGGGYADHLEETILPAETLGTQYVVTVPSSPVESNPVKPAVAHMIRFIGSVDNTELEYDPVQPSAPIKLNAGEVVTKEFYGANFQVTSTNNKPFMVETVMLGSTVVDPKGNKGDPSISFAVATAQYRKRYVFLAPTDYILSFADVVAPVGATLELDGSEVSVTPSLVGASGFAVTRIQLGNGRNGAHVLVSDQPIGIQVMGYGNDTSYQYPGGINLRRIAEPPPIM